MQVVANSTSPALLPFYQEVRAYTEQLCAPLETEDYVPQPIADVSPPKWNIAHTTWFFEEMILKPYAPAYREFHPTYGFLFNSYYNTVGVRTRRDQRGALSRPTVAEIFKYRNYVDEAMCELLRAELPPAVTEAVTDLVILGLHHEQQHQELLLMDLKYILSCNPLFPVYEKQPLLEEKSETSTGEFIEITTDNFQIGHDGNGFCFDNECGRHEVRLNAFSICNKLVTNAEYLEFIADGGYRNFNLWHAEGWDWVNQQNIEAPLYWHSQDGIWRYFTLAGLREILPQAPVCHVSFYEAAAFAEWKRMRLPTEFEWETAASRFNWGLRWEWTNSAYLPYPNFKKIAGAVGEYNGKFMVNQMVLRGASVVTSPNHSRKTYRNFSHPPLRWQFSGIRLAC